MSIEANKMVARRYFEEFLNQQRLDVMEEIVAPDAVDETQLKAGHSEGRDDFRRHAQWLWGAVQGVKTTVTDLIAEGDRVVVYWKIEGVHQGVLFGVPPTGKAFIGSSISTITVRDGKVVRYAVLPDKFGMIKQLGGTIA